MTRLRSLIKEVLSQPKKKDCGCGCNDCGGKAPILTENKVKHLISEGLKHHIDKKISLFESVYRIGSEKHLELIREARALWIRGIIEVSDDDKGLLETHLGHFGLYEGVEVPLDLPMVNEVEKDINQLKNLSNRKERYNYIKNFSKEKLIDIADELYLDYEEYDDIEDKVLNSFGESLNEEIEVEKSIKDIEDGDVILYKGKEFKVDYIDPWSAGGRILNGTDLKSGKKGKLKVKFVTPKGSTGTASDTMLTVLKESLNEKVLSENQLDQIEDWKFQDGWGFIKDYRREDEVGINKKIAFLAYNSEGQKDLSKGQSLNVGLLDKLTPKIGQRLVNQLKVDYLPSAMKITKDMIKQAGVDMVIVVDHNVSNKIINESKKKAKSKKKDPPIGKPKRGGSKAYYVYVRDPKTKRIKKVSFGSGGLRAKIRNPKARKAFAARHRCAQKNDRTKASYWSCRLPRYAKQLGLGSNMNTFW